jgi:HAE1 family hydrophobic/amphiphilic exporter-1
MSGKWSTYPEATSWNYLHGQAVVLSLQRQSGSNTLDVIEAAKGKLQQIRSTLPPGTKIEIISDNSTFIKASVASLEEHLLLGSLLASLVVMLFIGDMRSVIIAALAIPASVIATFTLLKAMNFTLNSMTLLGLNLAVGIVIDDAIVVLEILFATSRKGLRASAGGNRRHRESPRWWQRRFRW